MDRTRGITEAGTGGAPVLPDVLLERTALLDRLSEAGPRAVVVCGPTGAGKSTLVSHWARDRAGGPVTWLADGTGADLDGIGPAATVVVDGVRGDDPVAGVRGLVDHAARARIDRLLVLLRDDVTHGLADRRLTGTVSVIHARDLELAPAEVRRLVGLASGLEPADEVAKAVCDALGGWITGVAEVAGRWDPDTSRLDHRDRLAAVYADLAERAGKVVAETTAPDELAALRRIACLPALSPELWDRLLERDDGAAVLGRLRGAGAFVSDSRHRPDLLELHPLAVAGLDAAAGPPDPELLGQAAAWFGEHQLPLMAARCHVALDDWDAVAVDVLSALFVLMSEERMADFVDFLADVPIAVLRDRYTWGLGASAMCLSLGRIEVSQAILAALGPPPDLEQTVTHGCHLAAFAGFLEDPRSCLDAAERALVACDELGEDHHFDDQFTTARTRHYRVQARCSGLVPAAYLGEWERFEAFAAEPVDAASMVEIPAQSGLMPTLGRRAIGLVLAGRLRDAAEAAEGSLGLAHVGTSAAQTSEARVALADVALLQGRPDEAEAGYRLGLELLVTFGRTNSKIQAASGLAELRLDRAEPAEALAELAAAVPEGFLPPHTIRARLAGARALAQHRLGQAGLAAGELDAAPRTVHLAATAVLIALERGQVGEAQRWLDQWPEEPIVLGRVLRPAARAAVAEWSGNRSEAIDAFREALAAAADDVLVQPIARFAVLTPTPLRQLAQEGGTVGRTAAAVLGLLDPTGALAALTDRERLVLHHLGMDATLPVVADRLVISQNTLRTQTQAIYRKLDVRSRAGAVEFLRRR